jgi:hypothetical protein
MVCHHHHTPPSLETRDGGVFPPFPLLTTPLSPPLLETQDGGGSPTLSCDGNENWPDDGEIGPK